MIINIATTIEIHMCLYMGVCMYVCLYVQHESVCGKMNACAIKNMVASSKLSTAWMTYQAVAGQI